MSRRIRALAGGTLTGVLMLGLTGCLPSNPLDDTITVTAYFPDSAGLFVGNDVGVLGVPVGEITDIEPSGVEVKVTMEVDADRAVPADAGAAVVARSVATDRYVELTPVYSGGPRLGDGAEIARDKTVTPVDFDDVLEALNTFATGISGSRDGTRAVKEIIESGEAAFRGRGQLFNETVRSLAEAVNGVAGQRQDIAQTLVSLDTLVNEIAENEGTARTFIRQVSRASRLLADERDNFRTALRSLDRAVTLVADFAVTNRDQVIRAIGGTSKVFRTMLRKQKQLTEVLEVMPLAMQNLERVVTPGDRAPVRVPPTVIFPFGAQIAAMCERLPGPVCDLISGSDPGDSPPRRTGQGPRGAAGGAR